MRRLVTTVLLAGLLAAAPAWAVEYEDVQVPDSVQLANQAVPLNGVGLREVFWVNVYIGALYLPQKATTPDAAIKQDGPKRIAMYFVHDAPTNKVVSAWNEGFADNNSDDVMKAIRARQAKFNSFDWNLKEGDNVFLDWIPGQGTQVTIKGKVAGTIEGRDFYDALMRIWLGPEPPGGNLKEGFLGQDD